MTRWVRISERTFQRDDRVPDLPRGDCGVHLSLKEQAEECLVLMGRRAYSGFKVALHKRVAFDDLSDAIMFKQEAEWLKRKYLWAYGHIIVTDPKGNSKGQWVVDMYKKGNTND